MITCYDSSERVFSNNGIKTLHPMVAEVYKQDNGDYYLTLRDSIDNSEYYQKGVIIRVDTPWGKQAFRCDNLSIEANRIDCIAWHVSYDAENYIIRDINIVDADCNFALNYANQHCDIVTPFTLSSNITTEVSSRIVRKSLYEVFNSFISSEKYSGHLIRDNYNVSINTTIGEDKGVVIADSKNITGFKKEENWSNVVTKILPYTTDGSSQSILLDDYYVSYSQNLYDIPYTKVVKFDNEIDKDSYETEEEYIQAVKSWLQSVAESYLENNHLPLINYTIQANISNISDVGDVIYVKHPKCKVNILTNVIAIKYDCIREKIINVEFGNFRKDIKNLTTEITNAVKTEAVKLVVEENSAITDALQSSTAQINSLLKDSYCIFDGSQILIVDTLPKEDAVNVIRINSQGIGFSQNGIAGTFNSAWTIDGIMNMQNINLINLTASMIRGGVLSLGGLNNVGGQLELYDNSNRLVIRMSKDGLIIYALNGDYVKLNSQDGFAGFNKNDVKIYWADGETFRMKNAEVDNEIKISGKIKIVPVSTANAVGVGFVAIG